MTAIQATRAANRFDFQSCGEIAIVPTDASLTRAQLTARERTDAYSSPHPRVSVLVYFIFMSVRFMLARIRSYFMLSGARQRSRHGGEFTGRRRTNAFALRPVSAGVLLDVT